MTQGIRPDGLIFASEAQDGELEDFPGETRGWGVTLDGKNADGDTVTDPTNGIPPMEWMNGILNKLSNQIFWNMQHALPAWSAGTWDVGAFVTYSGWVYYNSAVTETTGEPSISADWSKIFPLSNQDGRYLQIVNNLSEIAEAGAAAQQAARGNIGCGTAATHDVTTSNVDTAAGHVLQTGDYGLGKAIRIATGTDLADFLAAANGNFYHCDSPYTNAPPWFGTEWFDLIITQHETADYRTIRALSSSGYTAFAIITAGKFSGWKRDYTELQKPSASDVGAVPLGSDGTVTAINTLKNIARIFTSQTGTPLEFGHLSGTPGKFYMDFHTDGTVNGEDYTYRITFNTDKTVLTSGQWVPGDYANFDVRYQAKGNYTPAGQAYTKAESNARYVQGVQLGAEIAVPNDAGTIHAGQGSFWSSVNRDHSGADDLNWYSKPIQININGTWHNISG